MERWLFSYSRIIYQGINNGLTILQFPIHVPLMSGHYSFYKEIRYSLQKWLSLFQREQEALQLICNWQK
jgi:uncharacterized membrane protein (DUF441 family)